LLSSLAQAWEAGIAFRAHIGGFIAGLLLIRMFARSRPSRY
jgi:membrane associated rhomboid family serine protease